MFALMPAAVWAQAFRYDTIRRETRSALPGKAEQARTPASQAQAALRRQTQASPKRERTSAVREPSTQARTASARERDGQRRWSLGGSLGFTLSDSQWGLQLSPQIGYLVARGLRVGGGFTYSYIGGRHGWDYRQNTLGVNGLVHIYPWRYIVLTVQPEAIYSWGRVGGRSVETDLVPCLPVGAGAVIPVWRGGITFTVYYDVLQDHRSPYGSKLNTSVGYMFYW